MGTRKTQRIQKNMPVRIFGMDSSGKPFSSSAETLDVSASGARLVGVYQFNVPGETIGLEVKGKKGRFLVVWVGKKGTKIEGQVGLRSVDPVSTVWELSTPHDVPAPFPHGPSSNSARLGPAKVPLSVGPPVGPRPYDRRAAKRLAVKAGAKVTPLGHKLEGQNTGWGICTDLSRSGCYIETVYPLPQDSRLEVTLRLEGREIQATAVVRGSKPNWGMGIQFLKISDADRAFLIDLVENPEKTHKQGNSK
jgi:PilZ domain